MYQTSIRNKKNKSKFQNEKESNYIMSEDEDYGYVQKLLGNCRVKILSDDGIESIGIIRGSLRKFNKRILIENGDIVVISKRDFQDSKVDIVHKFNNDQCLTLINDKIISNVIANLYTKKIDYKDINNTVNNEDDYFQFNDDDFDDDEDDADEKKDDDI